MLARFETVLIALLLFRRVQAMLFSSLDSSFGMSKIAMLPTTSKLLPTFSRCFFGITSAKSPFSPPPDFFILVRFFSSIFPPSRFLICNSFALRFRGRIK